MSHSQGDDDPLQAIKDVVGDSSMFMVFAGTVVSFLTSYVPFSPLLGGLLVGWLVRDDKSRGAILGGLSGLLMLLPGSLFVIPFFGIALFDAASGIAFLFLFLVFGLIALVYTVGLGALGGYLGVHLYQKRVAGTGRAGRGGRRAQTTGRDDGWGEDDQGWGEANDEWGGDDADRTERRR